jgi:hypothetical protein
VRVQRPDGAVVLFDGTDLGGWTHRGGEPARWTVAGGAMAVSPGTGDLVSREVFRDALLHVEFRNVDMPGQSGQGKSNSGVFVQGRYELQVLDSHGWKVPGRGDCGAIYDQFAPLVNACLPPLQWQSYDIVFRAARVDPGSGAVEPARLTVLQNGLVIHNNVILRGPTGGALDREVGRPGPLRLQDHGHPVQYRNIWLLHLPEEGSSEYGPR